MVEALGERYRPLAPDIRGHGRASETAPVALESVIADIDALDSGRFTLAGYSMGGRLALHFALARPRKVTRLVLIGASPGIANPWERDARRRSDELSAKQIERQTIEQFAERWARTPVLAGQSAEVAARAHADRLRNTPAGLARALRGLGAGALPSLWDRLDELTMPVDLVVGGRDEKFLAVAERMVGSLPQGRLHLIPNSGHAAHLERPDAVAGVISGGR